MSLRPALTWIARAITGTAGHLARVVAKPPVGKVAGGVRALLYGAVRAWQRRPGGRARHLRRLASIPLPNLYELHPEARKATPREIGLRSIGLDDIAGTAVGGPTQRGSDFLPLPAFRSQNWAGRWQRIRRAVEQLAIFPPIDVVRYAGRYWVMDGHNRVAAGLSVGQVEIDANVTELVPPGQNPSERPGDLAAALAGTRSLRAAAQGGKLETVVDDVVLGVLQATDHGRASVSGPPRAAEKREPPAGPAAERPRVPEPGPRPEPVAAPNRPRDPGSAPAEAPEASPESPSGPVADAASPPTPDQAAAAAPPPDPRSR